MWQDRILWIVRRCVGLGAVFAMALLFASYFGHVHPLGDSLAVFRIWVAGALGAGGVLLFVLGGRLLGALATAATLFALVPIVVLFLFEPRNGNGAFDVMVYSKNTLGGRGDDQALVDDILAMDSDVVLLQEVSAMRSDYARDLSVQLPHAHFCSFSDGSGIGVVSRWPIDTVYCSPHRSFGAAYIQGPDGGFWAVSTHLVWPYPYAQSGLLDLALPFLAGIEGPAIVAGDFNMVPWGASVDRIEKATGTRRIGRLYTTLYVGNVPFQIDHILTTGTGQVDLRPRFGSDHHGVFGQILWSNAP